MRTIVPWLEVNVRSKDAIESAIEGLKGWQKIARVVILSVDAGKSKLWLPFFETVRRRLPGLKIIPGLKTSPVLGLDGFESCVRWSKLANDLRLICKATGTRQAVLENESALRQYHAGKFDPNWSRVIRRLKFLPKNIEYLWYPSAAGSGEMLKRYTRLVRIVDKSLQKVRFLDHAFLFSPEFVNTPGTLKAVAALEKATTRPTIPIIYCYDHKYWPYNEVPGALKIAESHWGKRGWTILYPGAKNWVESAKEIGKALKAKPKRKRLPKTIGTCGEGYAVHTCTHDGTGGYHCTGPGKCAHCGGRPMKRYILKTYTICSMTKPPRKKRKRRTK